MHAAVLVTTAVVGSGLAAYLDVKTTEIPDSYGLAMAGIGVAAHLVHGWFTGSFTALWHGLGFGVVFGMIGYLLYRGGAWGGADAVLLAALAVLIPGFSAFNPVYQASLWPVAATFFINVWVVGAVYELVYIAVLLGSVDVPLPSVTELVDVRSRRFGLVAGAYVAASAAAVLAAALLTAYPVVTVMTRFIVFSPVVVVFAALFNGLKWVEEEVMYYRVDAADVQRGDMVAEPVETGNVSVSEEMVRGLTREEAAAIRQSDVGEVTLRTGISFAPVFPLAVLLTVFFGDVIMFTAALV